MDNKEHCIDYLGDLTPPWLIRLATVPHIWYVYVCTITMSTVRYSAPAWRGTNVLPLAYIRTYVLCMHAHRAYLRWMYSTTVFLRTIRKCNMLTLRKFFLAATVDPELCMDVQKIHKCSSVLWASNLNNEYDNYVVNKWGLQNWVTISYPMTRFEIIVHKLGNLIVGACKYCRICR